jgi:hypothetical protein
VETLASVAGQQAPPGVICCVQLIDTARNVEETFGS